MTATSRARRAIKYTIRFLVPIIVLTIILCSIDTHRLGENFLRVRIGLFPLALIVSYICQILVAQDGFEGVVGARLGLRRRVMIHEGKFYHPYVCEKKGLPLSQWADAQ